MSINLVRDYPAPGKFQTIEEINDYLERLYRALTEGDYIVSERLRKELDQLYEPLA